MNFEPSVGGEVRKRRPAVIVSNDASNLHLNRVQAVAFLEQAAQSVFAVLRSPY